MALAVNLVAIFTAATAFIGLCTLVVSVFVYQLAREMAGRRRPIIIEPSEFDEPLLDYDAENLPYSATVQLHGLPRESEVARLRTATFRVYNQSQIDQRIVFDRFRVWWPIGVSYYIVSDASCRVPTAQGGDVDILLQQESGPRKHPRKVFATLSGNTLGRRKVHYRGTIPLTAYEGDVIKPKPTPLELPRVGEW